MVARQEDLGPQLSSRLTYLLKRALLDLEDLHRDHLASTGINVRELTVLQFLDGREPESQQQVASHLGVDRTTMVGLIDALERLGLVERRADASDRRRNVVQLTEAGRRTLAEATRASDEAERRLLGALDQADATRLRELLQRLASSPR
ncbi:MarR family winged helix-turn-helix transcriptional regulator [Microlunatus antarcticus]|uniref:DNA-binding MarR family transcriptional regulator n=1 Tax=Microlunatus antarcticus TaxID=53388 RepID=A0A7W5JX93_9ACTN|nr:MarR family winged helix-turn-helix transcriptional regulator [Microlunatus antarcticus]MBB3327910.1 DNA-binding MarR family transcriptional regulator [Microlunatus antarcticus]